MKEAYCSPEVTKLLEEKGFPKGEFTHYEYDPKGMTAYKTCTHQKAVSWLRGKGYEIEVRPKGIRQDEYDESRFHTTYEAWVWQPNERGFIDNYSQTHGIYNYAKRGKEDSEIFDRFEDAIEESLKYILKYLIQL